MKKALLIAGLLCGYMGFSQIRVGFENNSQWYIDDDKVKIDENEAEDRFRANSYLKLDYDWKNWSFGAQLEGYTPKAILNYSPDLEGVNIGALYARYNNRQLGLDVTAGHFYDQFGSGLLYRSWEDRQLGINNALLGLNVKYDISDWGRITALGGKQRIGMGFDLAKSFLFGGDLDIDAGQLINSDNLDLNVGVSYLGTSLESNDENKGLDNFNSGYSFRFDYRNGGFYIGSEYVLKDKDYYATGSSINKTTLVNSNAWLVNLGYFQKGMSFDFNFRRLENMASYSERQFIGNDFHKGVLNYLPALVKQYDYSLQNIYVYQAQASVDLFNQKNGEIGGQFDFYYEFPKGSTIGGKYGTNLVINGSYWAGLKAKYDLMDKKMTTEFMSFGNKYYRDFGIEVRKRWSKQWSSIFMYLDQYYNAIALESKLEEVKANIVSAETTYQFLEEKSVRLELQHMWADKDKKNWVGGTLEFTYNANWSLFVNDMYNYGNDDKDSRIHYYNAGVSFTKGTTRISTSYGRQRGGLLCVGGVCRMVSEAAGLTVGITTSF